MAVIVVYMPYLFPEGIGLSPFQFHNWKYWKRLKTM